MLRLAVVIPAYNEAEGIVQCVQECLIATARLPGRVPVLVVDDGSSDDTAMRVSAIEDESDRIRLVRRLANGGYGAALRSGADAARGMGATHVVFMDSDLTNPPQDIVTMHELLVAGADYVKASRFLPGGGWDGVPAARRRISRAGNVVARLLVGPSFSDVTNGFRACSVSLFLSLPLHERGFPIIVEECVAVVSRRTRTAEFPSVLTTRSDDQRPSAFSYRPRTFWLYLRHPLRYALDRLRHTVARRVATVTHTRRGIR